MGVRGLMSFLERENHKKQVNVSDEIRMWIKKNPDCSPIIVFDFVALTHNDIIIKDNICGGRHEVLLENFEILMAELKATGAKLIFFSDLNAMPDKIDQWLQRRDESFKSKVELYDLIRSGRSFNAIVSTVDNRQNLSSASLGMRLIAQKYGEFQYAIHNDCDLELARYAKENDVFAVVTDDSDFMIFEGNFKFWKASEFGFSKYQRGQVTTTQYDRNGLADSLNIEPHQRALFATLMGNGIIDSDTVFAFQKTLGHLRTKIQNIAKYVIRVQGDKPTLNNEFKVIARDVFRSSTDNSIEMVKKGVDSYNLKYPKKQFNDKLAERLIGTPYYWDYVSFTRGGQGFTLSFYDMRGKVGSSSLPMILLEWVKRKTGIVLKHKNEASYTFIALIKTAFNEKYRSSVQKPIYPDFDVPALDTIYTSDVASNVASDIQWKLLAFIMSLKDDVISAIKAVPSEFQIICTALYAMVKGGFASVDEADGILITEYLVRDEDASRTVRESQHPTILDENNVRVAHVYNNMMPQVRQNFTIAGLAPSVSAISHFDGVYYQNLMASSVASRQDALAKCKNYRIYV